MAINGEQLERNLKGFFKDEMENQKDGIEKNLKVFFKDEMERNLKIFFKSEIQPEMEKQREKYQMYLRGLTEDFDSKIKVIAEQYQDIKDTLRSHTEMIGILKENVEIIKADIIFIKDTLNNKVDIEQFEVLENKVRVLEMKVV